jgi:transposase InsO family protein
MAPISVKSRELDRLWTQPGESWAAFAGQHLLRQAAAKSKLSADDVRDYLTQEPAYTQHAPRRLKFPKPFYNMTELYHLVEIDLIETGRIAQFNDGVRYLFLAIECTSRKIFVVPLKDKSGKSSTAALRQLLTHEFEEAPHILRTDRGSEFKDARFQRLLKQHGIRHLYANNTEKAGMAERAVQTLQRRIHRYLTYSNTLRFLPVLQDIVKSINDTPHSSTSVAPNKFTRKDIYPAWERYYLAHVQGPRPFRFAPGDTVRVSRLLDKFEKSFRGTYSPEVFTVAARRRTKPHSYELVNILGEPIQGVFFEQELIHAKDRPDQAYPIEDIVKRRKNPTTGQREVQVTWQGWPKSVRNWLPEKDVVTTSQ